VTCSVDGCENPVATSGQCSKHYMRGYRATKKRLPRKRRSSIPLVELWDNDGRAHVAFETARATFCLRPLDALTDTPTVVEGSCARCEAGRHTVPYIRSREQLAYLTRLSNAAIHSKVLEEEGLVAVLMLAEKRIVVPPYREKRAVA
jgi:hypothetical protein